MPLENLILLSSASIILIHGFHPLSFFKLPTISSKMVCIYI